LPTHADKVAASVNPPAGLAANNVPMFVMLGFDDNAYADGVNWVVDELIGSRKNQDGSPALVTFFLIAGASTTANAGTFTNAGGKQTEADVLNAWKHAYAAGHEIGNHTWDHAEGGDTRSLADWQTEVNKAASYIPTNVGIDACQLAGFRFPYLLFDANGFDALAAAGVRYDVSVEFGYDWWNNPPFAGYPNGISQTNPDYGKHFWWPFTLDNGWPAEFSTTMRGQMPYTKQLPGMWEFPVNTFTHPDPSDATKVAPITGLDYNVWITKPALNLCDVLKYSFDQRYGGNRAPFNLGVHSDIYSLMNATDDSAFGNFGPDRRAALKCFVDYAIAKPDVRFTTFKNVIEWMRSPKAIH
jgi:hypothetical protein